MIATGDHERGEVSRTEEEVAQRMTWTCRREKGRRERKTGAMNPRRSWHEYQNLNTLCELYKHGNN